LVTSWHWCKDLQGPHLTGNNLFLDTYACSLVAPEACVFCATKAQALGLPGKRQGVCCSLPVRAPEAKERKSKTCKEARRQAEEFRWSMPYHLHQGLCSAAAQFLSSHQRLPLPIGARQPQSAGSLQLLHWLRWTEASSTPWGRVPTSRPRRCSPGLGRRWMVHRLRTATSGEQSSKQSPWYHSEGRARVRMF